MENLNYLSKLRDEQEKKLFLEAQKIVNEKFLAYSQVYSTTEESILFKMILLAYVKSNLKNEVNDDFEQEVSGKVEEFSKIEDIKDRIVLIMEEEGLSLALFARKIGINASTLLHIVRGRNAPTLQVIQAIHKVYPNIDLNWLIG